MAHPSGRTRHRSVAGSELVATKNSGVSTPKHSPPSVSTIRPASGLLLVISIARAQYCRAHSSLRALPGVGSTALFMLAHSNHTLMVMLPMQEHYSREL